MSDGHSQLLGLLSRRQLLQKALIASTLPYVLTPAAARAASPPSLTDATLQAFADTIIPGRKVTSTALGNAVDPLAIAGVDSQPGAVEADALALYHHPEVGFDALAPPFLTDLETRSLTAGGDFLHLGFEARVQVCLGGLDFSNPVRLIWEAAAAVPFTAFCAAALIRNATAATAPGYRVMGLPGVAPDGYRNFSFGRRMSRERTRHGWLP